MRLRTLTDWAYGTTVVLTLIGGGTMIMASVAQQQERAATQQRHHLDQATSHLEKEVYRMTDKARDYIVTGNPINLEEYRAELGELKSVQARIERIGDAGAQEDELTALAAAMTEADKLHEHQEAAIAAFQAGETRDANQILFGPIYQKELDLIDSHILRFQSLINQRTLDEIEEATQYARLWRHISEIMLALTAGLFLFVLYFVIRQRILRPVVRLNDVVTRLAAQDYSVEPLDYREVDEIGDITQAVKIFRENGLERLRLEEQREADLALRNLLSRMTQRMQACDSLDELAGIVERFAPKIVPGHAGRLYILEAKTGVMRQASDWNDPQYSKEEFSPLACWALRRGGIHKPGGEVIDVPCSHLGPLEGHESPATICIPLTAQREMAGLLYFERKDEVTSEPSDVYLTMLAENIALSLSNIGLRTALRQQAMADALTGLANRRQLDQRLSLVLADAEKDAKPVSCVMIDVDFFKKINDVHGHDAGDVALQMVGEVLATSTREDGLAFRVGGEEFLILLPGLEPERAAERAEDIRKRIEDTTLSYNDKTLSITASFGVAGTPAHGDGDEFIQKADLALLRAKDTGRNCVVIYSDTTRAIEAA